VGEREKIRKSEREKSGSTRVLNNRSHVSLTLGSVRYLEKNGEKRRGRKARGERSENIIECYTPNRKMRREKKTFDGGRSYEMGKNN